MHLCQLLQVSRQLTFVEFLSKSKQTDKQSNKSTSKRSFSEINLLPNLKLAKIGMQKCRPPERCTVHYGKFEVRHHIKLFTGTSRYRKTQFDQRFQSTICRLS